jgi:hypothetical protein
MAAIRMDANVPMTTQTFEVSQTSKVFTLEHV